MVDFGGFEGINWINWIVVIAVIISGLLIVKKIAYSILDPWFAFGFNQIVYLTLITVLYINNILVFSDYMYWLVASTLLLLPFLLLKTQKFPLFASPSSKSKNFARSVNLIILFICLYQVIFDVAFILNRGIPVFTEGGSTPQIYMGGFGIVKYIHDTIKFIVPPLAIFSLFATGKRHFLNLSLFYTLYPCLLFEWSKVGLIVVLANYWIAYVIYFGYTKKLKRISTVGIAICALFVIFMFSQVAAAGYSDNALDALGKRVVESIDSAFLYFVLDAKTSLPPNYSFSQYIFSLVSPFFGSDNGGGTIGQVIQDAASLTTKDGYGPSPPAQIVGHIFLKDFGFVYTLVIGMLLFMMKKKIASLRQESAVFFLMLYNIIAVIAGDASLFFYYVFICIFLFPPIALAVLVNVALGNKAKLVTT